MNVVMIIPTGIGCEIGGHCGDGNAAARLLGACCDTLVLHPNVVNASDINEMPGNSLYVEGSHLDRFLEGKVFLRKVSSNKVLVVVNKADYQSVNAVSAARATLGLEAEILELRVPLRLIARMEYGVATGDVLNWKELVEQVQEHDFDALGIATPITIDAETLAAYFRLGGVNPVGGVEAVASRLIASALGKPVAHGPVDYALKGFTEIVDPRMAVEIITENFIHCLLKGLHKAPRISYEGGMGVHDIDCMVSPYGCFGVPHQACLDAGIPVIVVRENRSYLNHPEHPTQEPSVTEAMRWFRGLSFGCALSWVLAVQTWGGERAQPLPKPEVPSVQRATGGPSLAEDVWQPTKGWFTLHHDVMRTGRTQYSPGVPFEYVWHKEYWDELIAPEAEAIVAEDTVFLGTLKGILHALDSDTGREKWRADLGSPIHHSPAYEDGRLIVASLSPAEQVVAFEAASGRELWRFKPLRRGGFAASPAVYQGAVYIGDRAGEFYALDLATGRLKWTVSLGAPILQSASIKDGKVAVAAEDLVPHLLSAVGGREFWKGPQMTGATLRGYYPVFWRDLVVWRTDSGAISAYHNGIEQATEDGRLYRETRQKHGWNKEAEDIVKTIPGRFTEEKYSLEQEFIREQMKAGKHPRSFYAFKVSDGGEPVLYPVGYHASENGYSVPASPPVGQDGSLYVFTKSAYSQWTYPIRAFDAVSILDYANGLPRLIRGIDRSKGSFPATCDESNNLTIAGDKLYDTHDHVLAYMDIQSRRIFNAYSSHAPELWGGVFKAYAPDNPVPENPGVWKLRDVTHSLHLTIQWNGPAQGAVAIYKDKVWWITGSMVVCLKGTVSP